MQNHFLIAGDHSGAGKTTIALGLMAVLRKKGLKVQPFKCGPDFIDTGLHGNVCGAASHNLDLYMCGKDYVTDLFIRKGETADVSIIEGVMGLFDGGVSSSASLSKALNIPVILVIDTKSIAQSVGAILYGFSNFDKDVNIAGVIFNNIGSSKHQAMIEEGISVLNIPILGMLPRRSDISIPNRHLGLYTARDNFIDDVFLDRFINHIEKNIDIDRLLKLSQTNDTMGAGGTREIVAYGTGCSSLELYRGRRICLHSGQTFSPANISEPIVKIAVAQDQAFCFYYEENLQLLRDNGAEIISFSPIHDLFLPDGIDVLYLGGGYPELYGRELSHNLTMIKSIKEFYKRDGIIYAECGGFVYLTKGIYGLDGGFSPFVGIFPVEARMKRERAYLGYREIVLGKDTIIGKKGAVCRGHEFHYSEIGLMPEDIERVYKVLDKNEGVSDHIEGYLSKNCLASYIHLHFGSNSNVASHIVRQA